MTRWLRAARSGPRGFDKIDNTDRTSVLAAESLNAANKVNSVNFVSGGFSKTPGCPPDVEILEERAAIAEYDGGLSRADGGQLAAQCQGYENVVAFRAAQRKAERQHD